MATIGYATLQIIPSLKGVTEAIEKQVEGKVVNVTIEPKVDKRATEQAGQQAKATVEKHTKQVTVEPKVDQKAAETAGKQAGKTVNEGIASSAKSSAGKDAAKAIVDGIADGVRQEMPRGSIGGILVEGLAEGVKQGIDGVGIGGEVVTTISTGIRSGNLSGAIRDAVVPAIENIGNEIRSGAAVWAGGIADSLRSGDIQGATTEIATTVQNTTDLIADIGTTFGLQLDGVREFGVNAATTLSQFGTDVQGVINTASGLKGTFNEVGTLLETVLPGKAGRGAAAITRALAGITMPAAIAAFLIYEGGKVGGNTLQRAIDEMGPNTEGGKNALNQATAPGMGVPGASRDPIFGKYHGGYTGNVPTNQIAGVVHGGEYVIKASSTSGIQNAFPGLLDYLNNRGALPGYEKGGKVQLGNISQPGITTSEQQSMWDAVRGKFPSAILSSATRTVMTEGHADFHNAGRAIDISGPNMGSIAAWIASNYPDSLELIHSPFSRNIKNGKNVGDGTSFYGANTMAGHRDHVHWALGKSAAQAAGTEGTDMLSVLDPSSIAAPAPATASATTASASSSMSVPGSFSGLSSMGLSGLGVTTQVNADSPERTLQLGSAAGAAIEGQVASALDVFGIGDSPGWLKGLGQLASGIKVGGDSVAPIAARPSAATAPSMNTLHGGSGAQPGPGVVYNIAVRDTEDAFIRAQQQERENAAAKLARF